MKPLIFAVALATLAGCGATTGQPPSDAAAAPSCGATTDVPKLEAAHRVPPTYPADARKDGVEGKVKLLVTVTPAGEVSRMEVIESDPPGLFDGAAREALAKWRFEAGSDGRCRRTAKTFNFRLH